MAYKISLKVKKEDEDTKPNIATGTQQQDEDGASVAATADDEVAKDQFDTKAQERRDLDDEVASKHSLYEIDEESSEDEILS